MKNKPKKNVDRAVLAFGCSEAELREDVPSFSVWMGLCPKYSRYLGFYGYDRLNLSLDQSVWAFSTGYIPVGDHNILCHFWQGAQTSQTIFIAHGLFDHSGIYLHFVRALLGAGYSVVLFDFQGHGLSTGERTVVDNFNEYSTVFSKLIDYFKQHFKHTNLFENFVLAGQSTGGAVILEMLSSQKQLEGDVSSIVLLAPLSRPKSWWPIKLTYHCIGSWLKRFPRGFTVNSNDMVFVDYLKNFEPLQPNHISIRWIGAMVSWGSSISKLDKSSVPCLLVYGECDGTVKSQYTVKILDDKFSSLTTQRVPLARHHLVNEERTIRKKIFKTIVDFIRESASP